MKEGERDVRWKLDPSRGCWRTEERVPPSCMVRQLIWRADRKRRKENISISIQVLPTRYQRIWIVGQRVPEGPYADSSSLRSAVKAHRAHHHVTSQPCLLTYLQVEVLRTTSIGGSCLKNY